jgi:lipopolysaccharide/colanic/teichoic acid biosynthesis glycosyltransferase
MLVVGPSTYAVTFQNKYKEFIPYPDVRQKVKPRVTGWAQVNGYRGDFPDEEKNKEWIRKRDDIWYIENWSFGLDIKIILMTIFKMIKGDPNAY